MFATRLRLFRLRGITISADASWLLIVALLTWSLTEQFRVLLPGMDDARYWLMGLITALAFFACIVLHELGHALTAQRMGIPLRGVTLFLFGGVAELEGEPASAGDEFLMAIAGPVVSAVLGVCFLLLSAVGARQGWGAPVVVLLEYLGWINLTVLIFNLVPAFPLDGGRVFRSILWAATGNLRKATHWASLGGRAFAWLLMGLGIVELFSNQFVGGVWLILIGIFLNQAALGSYRMVLVRQALQGEPITRFMNPHPVVVPPTLDLQQWVEDLVYRVHHKMFPVVENGRLVGIISTSALANFPRSEWAHHTIGEAMRRNIQAISLSPHADAFQALEQMQRTGSSRLLVTEGGQLVGLVSLKDLLRFLELKIEMETNHEDGSSRRRDESAPGYRSPAQAEEVASEAGGRTEHGSIP